MMQATDVHAIIAGPMGGQVTRAANFVSPHLWFYKEVPNPVDFDLDGNVAAARRAGWIAGSDGIRAKGGVKLELEICTTTRQYRAGLHHPAVVTAQDRRILGNVKVKPGCRTSSVAGTRSRPTRSATVEHGNFDIVNARHHSIYPDPPASAPSHEWPRRRSGLHNASASQQRDAHRFIPERTPRGTTSIHVLDPPTVQAAMGRARHLASDQNTASSRCSTTRTSGW